MSEKPISIVISIADIKQILKNAQSVAKNGDASTLVVDFKPDEKYVMIHTHNCFCVQTNNNPFLD